MIENSKFAKCSFVGSDMGEMILRGCYFESCEFKGCKLNAGILEILLLRTVYSSIRSFF